MISKSNGLNRELIAVVMMVVAVTHNCPVANLADLKYGQGFICWERNRFCIQFETRFPISESTGFTSWIPKGTKFALISYDRSAITFGCSPAPDPIALSINLVAKSVLLSPHLVPSEPV